jgi:hypothetical protein
VIKKVGCDYSVYHRFAAYVAQDSQGPCQPESWRLTIAALNGDPGSYTNVQLVLRNALDEEGWLAD